jgi:hypothetical protein
MITNIGKNIIAKYLIGDAPAYASYIAMGCGPKPRSNAITVSNVNTAKINGTLAGATATSTITLGVNETTVGLVVGMGLEKVAGTGAFGGTTQIAKIVSIDSLTKITVTSTAANTEGTISFNVVKDPSVSDPVSYSVLSVGTIEFPGSIDALWVGAKITIISPSATGELETTQDTIITSINSYEDDKVKTFTVEPATLVDLLDADILVEVDPAKRTLDFEMFRVPISSRGYVNDNGVNKIILTAQLPTEERYEISEIGIYSAGANTSARQYDSKTISAFSEDESWKFNTGASLVSPSPDLSSMFPEYQVSLINASNVITSTAQAIKTTATNGIFLNSVRSLRYERPRFLNNVLLLKTNTSFIYPNNGGYSIAPNSKFLEITGKSIDLTKNSLSDILKLTFSLVAITGDNTNLPDDINIIVEFSNSDGSVYAKMPVHINERTTRLRDNRYVYVEKRLDELVYSGANFSWNSVNTIKVYTSATESNVVTHRNATTTVATLTTAANHYLSIGDYVYVQNVSTEAAPGFDGLVQVTNVGSNTKFSYARSGAALVAEQAVTGGSVRVPNKDYFIALDALKIDNVSTENPLYGMVGYSIIQNEAEKTVLKSANTSNYIEYRFILDVT